MAFTLKELAENPHLLDDVWAKGKQKDRPEDYDQSGLHQIDYEGLGRLVEEHPIVSGRRRRG